MQNYPPDPNSQRLTLAHALARLLEHTAQRVRDGIRSVHTLGMQRYHVGWMSALHLPPELADQLGAQQLAQVVLSRLTPPVLVAVVEHWRAAGGAGGRPLSLPSTAKRKSTLGRALRLAVARGELPAMPQLPEIGLPPLRPRQRILRTHDELLTLLGALPQRRAEWVSVAVWTCQRPGDVGRMRWSDVDLISRTPSMIIRSTKTRRPHGIRVKSPRPLVETLLTRRARLEAAGRPPDPTDLLVDPWPNVSRVLPVVCVRRGLPPLSAMDLRHTGFSWMVRRLGLTRAAQEWGGWSDFAMLSKYYAHALPAGLDQAADELASIVGERGDA
jgi:integrase